MKKPWRVTFHRFTGRSEKVRDFKTEKEARKLYDKIKSCSYYCSVVNRIDQASSKLAALAVEAIVGHRKLKDAWKKLKAKEEIRIRGAFKAAAAQMYKDLSQ